MLVVYKYNLRSRNMNYQMITLLQRTTQFYCVLVILYNMLSYVKMVDDVDGCLYPACKQQGIFLYNNFRKLRNDQHYMGYII